MSSSAEMVASTSTFVTIRGRTGRPGIEGMGYPGFQPIQTAHHTAPLPSVGAHPLAVFEMMNEPMGHFMGDDVDKIGQAILRQQDRIEAQPAAAKMRLARAFATQIQPYLRQRQCRIDLPSKLPGGMRALVHLCMQLGLIESRQLAGSRRGKDWDGHEMLECLVAPLTDAAHILFPRKPYARNVPPSTAARR